jgi:iron complex outermembrane receptor protein
MKQFLKTNFIKAKFLVAFLMISSIIFAQKAEPFTLSGKVVDENNNPLPNATVKLLETNQAIATDFNGYYEFEVIKRNYSVEVTYVGYQSAMQSVDILKKRTTLNFYLLASTEKLDEVLVSAIRAKSTSPVTFSNIDKKDLEKRNLGQDIPILMNYLPSVVTTSDAGAGVGYTGIRVRGSDATRVNVTINGIPYNDSESQGTFWVNMPDFTSSVENLQLQRGVGTSTNGSGAFGASLNMLTDAISNEAYGQISSAFGSYNTQKHTVKFSTGLINDHIEIAGRLSKIDSDGYIDRAWSDLKSYFLQAAYKDDNTLIKALTFGGHEKTYQSWYGVSAYEIEEFGRTHNPYTYENEIDNYQQDHYQFHWSEKLNEQWSTNIGLNYTNGSGYFEQYKEDEDFSDYDLTPITLGGETIDQTDLIRRRWLDNDFYVANFNATYKNNTTELVLGTMFSKYSGDHFGEIIWAEYASNSSIRDRYYFSDAQKNETNIFAKLTHILNDSWTLFTDLQGRFVHYETEGLTSDRVPIDVDADFSFFNPKAGITYKANNNNNFYLSYARAHREPSRNDFENDVSKAEKLNDFELGWRFNNGDIRVNTNVYYMLYKDQLVLTGALDDVGNYIRGTSGESYRLGLEVDAYIKLSDKFVWQPNFALSNNRNVDFFATINEELVDLGNTDISFSPNFIASNAITFLPTENFQISLLSKFVGEQRMGNFEGAVSNNDILDSYFVNDLNITYIIKTKKIFKSITLNALINNIFDEEYISNGYYYTYDDNWSNPNAVITVDGAGYYPQATRNFLVGATLKF